MGSLLVLLLAAVPKAHAAPGDLDPSFSRDGKVVAYADYFAREPGIGGIALQADGSIIAAGDIGLVRFNPVGTVDDSFTSDPDRSLTDVALQPDGKIVAAGFENDYSGGYPPNGDFMVARYDPDGGFDETFSGDGIATTDFGVDDDGAKALALQPDGKIVVVGYSAPVPGNDVDFALARYNPNGTPDTSFSGDGKLTANFADTAHDVALQSDGKIIVAGSASGDFAVARYDEDGDLDPAFSGDGRATVGFTDSEGPGAHAIVIQPNGKIVAAGGTSGYFTSGDFALARFDPDGSLDAEFGVDGVVTTSFGEAGYVVASDVVLEPGRLLAAGRARGDFALARYGLGGALDPGFSGDGRLTTDLGYGEGASSIAVQPDGRIVVGGDAYYTDGNLYSENYGALARYLVANGPADADADGVLDADDRCPQVFAPQETDGCPRYRRSVDLYLSGTDRYRAFAGALSGPLGCTVGSRVRIYRLKRGGRRVKVASGTAYSADREGDNYWIPTKRTRGRYRAKLRPKFESDVGWCSGAKSDVLRIQRK